MTTAPQEPSEVADQAAILAAHSNGIGPVTSYTLANGIVLKLKPVPPLALRAASARIPEPVVPKVRIESQDRDEDNPNDPNYQMAVMQKSVDQTNAMFTVALLVGTAVDHIPDGLYGPDDDGWITELREALALVGDEAEPVAIREAPERARYLDWLRLYAVVTDADLYMLSMILVQGVVLSESEVQAAMASFRDRIRRYADLGIPIATPALNGNRDPAVDAGDGAGVRGEASG